MVIGIVLAVIGAALVLWVITGYNGFIKAKNNVEESFSTMDVYLKKRFDLIPNLVETVKGYAKHESQTLENVIAARSGSIGGGFGGGGFSGGGFGGGGGGAW